MRISRKIAATALASTLLATAFGVAGAGAETQNVTGTLAGTITISSAPADATLAQLPVTAAAIGSITVDANTAYTLSVKSLNATMKEWDSINSVYGTNVLSSGMTMSAVNAGTSTGVGNLAVPVGTTAVALATNPLSGILTTSDTYDLTVTQPATALDPAGTYRHELTYTVSSGV